MRRQNYSQTFIKNASDGLSKTDTCLKWTDFYALSAYFTYVRRHCHFFVGNKRERAGLQKKTFVFFLNRSFFTLKTFSSVIIFMWCNAFLTLSWRTPLSYRKQSIDWLRKSMDWFLYDIGLLHEISHSVAVSFPTKVISSGVFNPTPVFLFILVPVTLQLACDPRSETTTQKTSFN